MAKVTRTIKLKVPVVALTVAVNYADILAWTIKNRVQFDRWLVVTSQEDLDTQRLCAANGVDIVQSEKIHANGAKFAKAAALNEGLENLPQDCWIVVMDADIVLPRNFRERLDTTILDRSRLYGLAGRKICEEFGTFALFHDRENWEGLATSDIVLGYFQLFWNDGSVRFPEISTDASHYDMVFAEAYSTRQRFLPIGCLHLGPVHTNWKGRIAAPFRPRRNGNVRGLTLVEAVESAITDFSEATECKGLTLVQWGVHDLDVSVALLRRGIHLLIVDSSGVFTGQSDVFLKCESTYWKLRFRRALREYIRSGQARILGPANEAVVDGLRSMKVDGWVICGEPEPQALGMIARSIRHGGEGRRFVIGMYYDLSLNRAFSAMVNAIFGTPDSLHGAGIWRKEISARAPLSPHRGSTTMARGVGVNYVLTRRSEMLELLATMHELRKVWLGGVQVTCMVPMASRIVEELRAMDADVLECACDADTAAARWAHGIGLSRYDVTLTLQIGSFLSGVLPNFRELLKGADLAFDCDEEGVQRIREQYLDFVKRCRVDASRMAQLWPTKAPNVVALLWRRHNRGFVGASWLEEITDIAFRSRQCSVDLSREALLGIAAGGEQRLTKLNPVSWTSSVGELESQQRRWLKELGSAVRVAVARAIVTVIVSENKDLFIEASARWQFQPKARVYVFCTPGVDAHALKTSVGEPEWEFCDVATSAAEPEDRASEGLLNGLRQQREIADWCYLNASLLPSMASELFQQAMWSQYDVVGYCWFLEPESRRRFVAILGGFGCVSQRVTTLLREGDVAGRTIEEVLNHVCISMNGKRTAIDIGKMGWFDERDVDDFVRLHESDEEM